MTDFGLLGIFSAGLLTFLTPCVLPLMPIYLSALIGADVRQVKGGGRGKLLIRAALFSLGFILVFTLMGLTASSIGSVLSDHKAAISGAGAILILIFGLKFLGVIRIPIMDRIVKGDDARLNTRFGGINALIMGVVFAAGWSPCVGPVLGAVLTYTASASSSPAQGAFYLFVYGAGFAVPLLITALFAEAGVKLLKKINPHLPKIEKAIGVMLLLVSVSLFSDLSGEFQDSKAVAQHPAVSTSESSSKSLSESFLAPVKQPVMVEFMSKNCPICERMNPIVESLVTQCDGKSVRIKQIDLSQAGNRKYIKQYRLIGAPTFVFLDKDGEEAARLVGEQTEATLKQAISALRGQPCPGLALIDNIESEDSDNSSIQFPKEENFDNAACSQQHLNLAEASDLDSESAIKTTADCAINESEQETKGN